MFDERIGGWTMEQREREYRMQNDSFKWLKERLGKEFEEELDRCKRNLTLNPPQSLQCCKTCRNYTTFGNYGSMGHCPTTKGCSALGIAVDEFWHCGKWECLERLIVGQRARVNENFVAEALAVRKRNEEYERKRREAENSQKEDKRNV